MQLEKLEPREQLVMLELRVQLVILALRGCPAARLVPELLDLLVVSVMSEPLEQLEHQVVHQVLELRVLLAMLALRAQLVLLAAHLVPEQRDQLVKWAPRVMLALQEQLEKLELLVK